MVSIKPPAGPEPVVIPSDRWVETQNQTVANTTEYAISIWARGSGNFTLSWTESNVVKFYDSWALTEDWTRYTIQGGTTATTGRVRIHSAGASGTTATLIQTAALQLEKGNGATSFMHYSTPPATPITDAIAIHENLNVHGCTLVWWFQYRNDDDEKYLLYYLPSATASEAFIISVRADDLRIAAVIGAPSELNAFFSGVTDGDWVQLVVTIQADTEAGDTAYLIKAYLNGAFENEAATGRGGIPLVYATGTPLLYLGGDAGENFATFDGGAANMAIDSFRIDARVWTAADVLNDYDTRSDEGIQHLLQMVQGRYFMASRTYHPDGPFTDIVRGYIDFHEVDVRRQTVP
jgi:hypothetical protein